jgi:hypothetical protein
MAAVAGPLDFDGRSPGRRHPQATGDAHEQPGLDRRYVPSGTLPSQLVGKALDHDGSEESQSAAGSRV